jgi:isopenicillin N synthase-like dioxygenase
MYQGTTNASSSMGQEIFGAHTDSTFLTVVPAAAVAGLEIWDEDAEVWMRPEVAARLHYKRVYAANDDDSTLPWHARYVILMPGEFLQVVTRNEVPASVHRVVVMPSTGAVRYSAPVLFRGRPNMTLNVTRYLGSDLGYSLLKECNGMTMQEIHHVLQTK